VAGVLSFMGGYPDPVAAQGELYKHRLVEAFKHIFAVKYLDFLFLFVFVYLPVAAASLTFVINRLYSYIFIDGSQFLLPLYHSEFFS
jgi:hypothetical protein